MSFRLFSKTTLGGVTLLSLILLLTQSNLFDFFINTSLGRGLLIFFILFISYTHHILGIASVLFIIIMISHSDNIFYENFQDNTNEIIDESFVDESFVDEPFKNEPVVGKEEQILLENVDLDNNDNYDNLNTDAVEGFDIVGKERYMQKGFQSNSIPVSDFMKNSQNILPSESSNVFDSVSIY
jgi:hypothetical protein